MLAAIYGALKCSYMRLNSNSSHFEKDGQRCTEKAAVLTNKSSSGYAFWPVQGFQARFELKTSATAVKQSTNCSSAKRKEQ